MKKFVSVLAIALCAVLFLSPPVAGVTDNVYFTVVNDRLQELEDASMPFASGGKMYVPVTLFNQTSLMTYSVYDRNAGAATIFSTLHYLRFDLDSSTAYDDSGNSHFLRSFSRNSTVYVPVEDVCSFFGFEYSIYYMSPAPFVRIKNSNARFSDADFAKSKALSMQSVFNTYYNVPTPSVPPVYTPAPTPAVTGDMPPEENVTVYLSFRGINDDTAEILSSLSYYGLDACFFVTADEIRENPDLIRRISGSGHTVGFLCSEKLAEDYRACAAAIRSVLRTESIIVSLSCEYTPELKSRADELGVILWNDGGAPFYNLGSEMSPRSVFYALEGAKTRLDLSFECLDGAGEVIDSALYYLYRGDCTVEPIRETSTTFLKTSGVS